MHAIVEATTASLVVELPCDGSSARLLVSAGPPCRSGYRALVVGETFEP